MWYNVDELMLANIAIIIEKICNVAPVFLIFFKFNIL